MSIDLSATTVSNAFYWGELENELRDLGMMDFTIKADSDREACMEAIEEKRREFLYPHNHCSLDCKKRGTKQIILINQGSID